MKSSLFSLFQCKDSIKEGGGIRVQHHPDALNSPVRNEPDGSVFTANVNDAVTIEEDRLTANFVPETAIERPK